MILILDFTALTCLALIAGVGISICRGGLRDLEQLKEYPRPTFIVVKTPYDWAEDQ